MRKNKLETLHLELTDILNRTIFWAGKNDFYKTKVPEVQTAVDALNEFLKQLRSDLVPYDYLDENTDVTGANARHCL